MAERTVRRSRRRRVLVTTVGLIGALVPAVATAPPARAASVVVGTALPHPPGVAGTMLATGLSGDGRYVAYDVGFTTGRYDRVTGTFVARNIRNLSANGRYARVGVNRVDVDTGDVYPVALAEAGSNTYGGPRMSADGNVWVVMAEGANPATPEWYVVDAAAGTTTRLPGEAAFVSGDGRWVTYRQPGGEFVALERATGRVEPTVGGVPWLSFDGRFSVSGIGTPSGNEIRVRDRESGTVERLLDRFPSMPPIQQTGMVGVSDDGQRIAYVSTTTG